MDRTALVVTAIIVATALAGCAQLPGGGLSNEEARQAYLEAFDNFVSFDETDAVAIDSTATANGTDIFRQTIEVEPDRPAWLAEFFFSDELAQGQTGPLGNNPAMGAVVEDGVQYSVLPNLQGNLSRRRDHVPEISSERFDSFDDIGSSQQGGENLAPEIGPDMATVGLSEEGENITVESVEQVTHKDRDAWRIQFTLDNETMTADGEAIVYDDPRLPARIEVTMTFKISDPSQHPLFQVDEVTVTVDFRYDDEVDVTLPDAPLAPVDVRNSEQDTGDEITGSIRTDHQEEVPLDEVEMRIATPGNATGGGFGQTTPPPETIHFTMPLSDGSKVGTDFELHYDDLDGNGYLSANDTYRAVINAEEHQGNVSIYWWDEVAMKYSFQPGFEVVAGLIGLVAAAAIVGRRD